MMNIPVKTHQSLHQPALAHEDFDQANLPFSAAKLTISLNSTTKKKIDEIVEDNFRNEKDVVINKNQGYIVLMRDTTIEAAESAVNRLKNRLSQLARYSNRLKKFGQVQGSAYILGPDKKTSKLQARFLDFGPEHDSRKNSDAAEFGIEEYLKWIEIPKPREAYGNPTVNIKV
jgi:hypothetical protein